MLEQQSCQCAPKGRFAEDEADPAPQRDCESGHLFPQPSFSRRTCRAPPAPAAEDPGLEDDGEDSGQAPALPAARSSPEDRRGAGAVQSTPAPELGFAIAPVLMDHGNNIHM